MATLVFDIETSALPVEMFDEAQQEYLFRETEKIEDAVAKDAKREEITRFMSLWPFTSQVVCIAMLNAETQRGQTIYIAEDFEDDAGEAGPVEFLPVADETELLTAFWDVAKHYDSVVTFNGRGFDVPFIYLRSALLNVPISKKNWLGYRYATEPHCDLAEQLTFYSVSGRDGAARKFNLDFYCKAFGIESPKSHGVTGMDVKGMMAEGKYREIAEYCLRDVRATVELYKDLEGKARRDKMILICFALKEEASPFRKITAGKPGIYLLLTGIGRANAEKSVREFLSKNSPELVLTCGFAGGLNPDLKLGEVVFEPAGAAADNQKLARSAKPAKFHCADRIATTVAEKKLLRAQTGADAVEMESAAIHAVCAERNIPCATVRVISDTAHENLPLDFNALSKPDKNLDFGKLFLAIAKSPGKIPQLMALQKKTKFAAQQLAATLEKIISA